MLRDGVQHGLWISLFDRFRRGSLVSRIDELNDQIRRANRKVEELLEASAQSMASTSNAVIVLGTALAGGIAVVAKDALPHRPPHQVLVLLTGAAVLTIASLVLGILVIDCRSRINQRAVAMWNTSKLVVMDVIVAGEGDEQKTTAAYYESVPKIVQGLGAVAADFEKEYPRMSNMLTWQISLLVTAVVAALLATGGTYYGVNSEATEVRPNPVTVVRVVPSSAEVSTSVSTVPTPQPR